ncbi:hypothetical protein EMIT0P265_110007 [Pseudomonas zeae]
MKCAPLLELPKAAIFWGDPEFPYSTELPTSAVHPTVDNLSTFRCNPSVTWLCAVCSLFVQFSRRNEIFKHKQSVSAVYHH